MILAFHYICYACVHTLTHAELELKSSQVRILVMHLRGLHLTGCYLVMD